MTAKSNVNRLILVGLVCALPVFAQTAHAGAWSFDFGFSPFWYPGPVYDYGYPYPDDYPDYYYYPDSSDYRDRRGSSDQRSTVSIEVLVQSALARRGYYSGPVDGVIGSGTRNAIREFQNDNQLPVTGQIDAPLVQALKIGRD
jgi:hypothetical protein